MTGNHDDKSASEGAARTKVGVEGLDHPFEQIVTAQVCSDS